MTSHQTRRSGPPIGGPAPELVDSGFALENADAPFLHAGLNLADMAHVLDLLRREIIPRDAGRQLLALLVEVNAMPAEAFPYDPAFGEPYNSRERFFVERLGHVAGWLHAGRPRREAARIALRLYLRDQLLDLVDEGEELVSEVEPERDPGCLTPGPAGMQPAGRLAEAPHEEALP
jgi:argininosuccinate lyase